MSLDKIIYNKSILLLSTNAQARTDVPFRLTLGHDEAVQIRRVNFSVRNTDEYNAGSHVYGMALSSADLEPVQDVAFTDTFAQFFNRHDVQVSEYIARLVITRVGFVDEFTRSRDFAPGELVLPRSPSGILYAATKPAADDLEAIITIYYQRLKVNQANMLTLMKIYKSIKPASIPRVIDT